MIRRNPRFWLFSGNSLTSALVSLRRHAPNELHGLVAILDLEVMLELEVVMLFLDGFFTGFSEDFLSLFFGNKLGTFVKGCLRRLPASRLKGSVQDGSQRGGYSKALVRGVLQILPASTKNNRELEHNLSKKISKEWVF